MAGATPGSNIREISTPLSCARWTSASGGCSKRSIRWACAAARSSSCSPTTAIRPKSAVLGRRQRGIHRGAKFSLFEGGIRVPAIISWPGQLPENQVRSQAAYACDWLPTIAELCGVAAPGVKLDGKSLVGLLKDERAPSPHQVLHWQIGPSWAVREGDWKLLVDVNDTTRGPGTVIPGDFLVNLKDDPAEKSNLADLHPEIVVRLKQLRADWAGELARGRSRTEETQSR